MLQSLSVRSQSASSSEDVSDADDDNSATSGTKWSGLRCDLKIFFLKRAKLSGAIKTYYIGDVLSGSEQWT